MNSVAVADDSVGLVHVIACVGDAQALRDVLLSDRSAVSPDISEDDR